MQAAEMLVSFLLLQEEGRKAEAGQQLLKGSFVAISSAYFPAVVL